MFFNSVMACRVRSSVVLVFLLAALCGNLTSPTPNSCGDCLILTPYINRGNASIARKLSEINSHNYYGISSYSGYITVKEEYNSNLFFWFFPALYGSMSERPWIIWLQGGPVTSSLMGLFELNGPLTVQDGKVLPRNVTWVTDYSVLYIDNPVGTGFSFTDDQRGYPGNEDDIGKQLLEFVQQFLKMFPELRSSPLFVAGQGYAGKHVPALAVQIHRRKDNSNYINLRGIAIGNGLIHPRRQMHYAELCSALGLLEGPQIENLRALEHEFLSLVDEKKMFDASSAFNQTIEYVKKYTGVSIFNMNKDPSSSSPEYEYYVTRPDVRRVIHVGNATFQHQNLVLQTKMAAEIGNSTKMFVEELLEHYGVMSYAGELDLFLPYNGLRYVYADLRWSQKDVYANAPRKRLRRFANSSVVAYKKAGGNFLDVVIRRCGHFVPKDQPEVAKFVIDRFIEEFK